MQVSRLVGRVTAFEGGLLLERELQLCLTVGHDSVEFLTCPSPSNFLVTSLKDSDLKNWLVLGSNYYFVHLGEQSSKLLPQFPDLLLPVSPKK